MAQQIAEASMLCKSVGETTSEFQRRSAQDMPSASSHTALFPLTYCADSGSVAPTRYTLHALTTRRSVELTTQAGH